ncbi:MAG: hypothetical protein HJJLKODD_00461 [Phycisphaerae bacterium]|nr:hypothetical protein [Phycisphaerae bacterium]
MPIDPYDIQQWETTDDGSELNPPNTYCENCAYDLRLLRIVGACPECGQAYNFRSGEQGVFQPHLVEPPVFDIFAAVSCGLLFLWLASGLVQAFDLWTLIFTGIFGYLGWTFGRQAHQRLRRFLRAQKIINRLIDDADEPS